MTTSVGRVLDRLSGPSLIAWPTFWLVLALSSIMTALTSATLFATDPLRMAIAILIGQLVMFAILTGGYLLMRHTSTRTRSFTIIPLIAIATAGRGISLAIALAVLGLQSPPQWLLRIGGSMLSNSMVIILVVLVVASISEHRALLAEYMTRNAELKIARERAHREITERHQEVTERIRRQLIDRIEDMAGQSPIDVRNAMQSTVEDVVRPLSHDLARQTPVLESQPNALPSPQIDWSAVASDATTGRPLPAVAVALTMIIIGATWTFTAFPMAAAASVLVSGFVVIWLLCLASNEILHRISGSFGPLGRSLVMTLLLVVTGLVTGFAATFTLPPDSHVRTVAASDAILIPILGWLLAGARAAQNQQRRLEKAMREVNETIAWEVARAGETQWQQRRALSRALHGPVQSAIGGAAVRLDLALQSGEPTELLIDELRQRVVDAIDLLGAQQPDADLTAAISQLRDVYQGACEIELHAKVPAMRRLASDSTCATASTDLISEAVWNAIRHGKARHVLIDVTPTTPATIRITVQDDGTTDEADHHPRGGGLGTQMLEEVTLEWSRTYTSSGTTLVALLPTA